MFYLSNVAIAVNISQPSVRIGGGLHALIHIFFLHGGSKSPKPFCDLNELLCLPAAASDFSKMTKIGFKIPPILVDNFLKAVFKVYRNPRVRTELAETFTIARTFNSLKNVTTLSGRTRVPLYTP